MPTPAVNAAIKTPTLSQGQSYQSSLQLGKTGILMRVAVNAPARIQFYSSAAAQQADNGRSTATPIQPGVSIGLIADLDLALPGEFLWVLSPAVIAFNSEEPRTNSIYITVTNTVATSEAINVSLLYLPLES